MASPRLPFLYPNLMRGVKSCEPSTYRSMRVASPNAHPPPRRHASRARFHTSPRRNQGTIQRRYGPAVDPNMPPPNRPKDEAAPEQGQAQFQMNAPLERKVEGDTTPEQPQTISQAQPQSQSSPRELNDTPTLQSEPQPDTEKATQSTERRNVNEDDELDPNEEEPMPEIVHETKQASAAPEELTHEEQTTAPKLDGNPLEGVLHMPSPSSYLTPTTPPHQTPNMAPPPYVHHFDTYTLVQDLANNGFSDKQSETIMKAVRKILQNNLDFANQNLTSKSDVENETYLFKAACSELQSSLQTARNSEIQRQRASRTSLEHEADILSQRTNQELSGLKDDIKGMFNDHKMTVRELQRSIDTSVQELNYKITVSLNSDSKSEIEGLRWILTRRAALAIAISAFMILLFLRYSSTQRSQNGAEKKKEAPPKKAPEARPSSEHSPTPQESLPVAHLSESLG